MWRIRCAACRSAFDDPIDDDEWKRELGVYPQDSITAGPWHATIGGRWSRTTNGEEATVTAWNYERRHEAFVGNAGLLYLTDRGLAPMSVSPSPISPRPAPTGRAGRSSRPAPINTKSG